MGFPVLLRTFVVALALPGGAASRWLGGAKAAGPQGALALRLRGGGAPITVVCTLKGEKYEVEEVSKVEEVWAAVEEQAGLKAEQQVLIFKGKKLLDGEADLSDACGVSEGDVISVVAARAKREIKVADEDDDEEEEEDSDDDLMDQSALAGAAGAGGGASSMASAMAGLSDSDKAGIERMMEQMGGKEGMKDMLKQMGLDGPMTPDKINGILGQIKAMFANPAIAQLFENPEILEQSRQQILGNPMLMQAYDSMGMGGLIRDPDAFRQQMEGMKQMLENPEMLTQAMSGLMDMEGDGLGGSLDDFDPGEL